MSDQKPQGLFLLNTNKALHSNVRVAGASYDFLESVFQISLHDCHQHLCCTHFVRTCDFMIPEEKQHCVGVCKHSCQQAQDDQKFM